MTTFHDAQMTTFHDAQRNRHDAEASLRGAARDGAARDGAAAPHVDDEQQADARSNRHDTRRHPPRTLTTSSRPTRASAPFQSTRTPCTRQTSASAL
jgi:hypothetical protein